MGAEKPGIGMKQNRQKGTEKMKMFRKALAILLLMVLAAALLPAAGFGEEEGEESDSAFEALRELMETQFSADIPVAQGEPFTTFVIDDDYIAKRVAENPKRNKESSYNKTPDGILCQILFENRQNSKRKDVKDQAGNPVQEYKIINSAINDNYEYEAVRYSNLTTEQMLYYAYLLSASGRNLLHRRQIRGEYSPDQRQGKREGLCRARDRRRCQTRRITLPRNFTRGCEQTHSPSFYLSR